MSEYARKKHKSFSKWYKFIPIASEKNLRNDSGLGYGCGVLKRR